MKASYNTQPKAIELMPDGYHLFRFDVNEVVVNDRTQYECLEVKIHGAITSNKLTEEAILEKWGGGIEQKLINDYNEFKAGLSKDASAETRYISFLTERKALKEHIISLNEPA